jgi:hypothetical protein
MKWGLTIHAVFGALLIGMGATAVENSVPTAAPGLAMLKGTITFKGEVPKSTIADDAGVQRELLRVDPKTRG